MPVTVPRRISAVKFVFCLFAILLLFSACGRKTENTNTENGTDPGQLARQYMANNKFDEAEAAFIKATQVTPENILNYGSLARLYLLKNDYDAATDELKKGLKISPDNQDLRLLLAEVYIKKGDKQSAINELKGILGTNYKNPKA